MKIICVVLFLVMLQWSCVPNKNESIEERKNLKTDTSISITKIITDSTSSIIKTDTSNKNINTAQILLLPGALQISQTDNDSITKIQSGTPMEETLNIVNKTLRSKHLSNVILEDCGVGPSSLAVWKNGLTLLFQNKDKQWRFYGWLISKASPGITTLKTTKSIGVGTTRQQLELTYSIKIFKTSLGIEFSTTEGFYGILEGPAKNDKIIDMWSGVNCIYR